MKAKSLVANIVKILISALLVFLLLRRIGLDQLAQNIFSANWPFLIIAVFCFMLSNVLGSAQWYLLLRSSGVDLSLSRVMAFYHVGLFFNNFLIGYIGGDAFRIYDIHRSSGDTTSALSTVFFDRFLGFFTMSTMAVFTSVYLTAHRFTSRATILTLILIFAVWVLGIMLLFNERLAQKLAWLLKLLLPGIVHARVRDVYYGINRFRHHRLLLVKVFGISVLVQSLRILTHYWTARAVNVHAPVIYFFVFIPIIALAASLPISLGGIGIREQSGVTLFTQIGLVSARIVAFEFLAYIVGIVATLPGGFIFAFRRENFKPPVGDKPNAVREDS